MTARGYLVIVLAFIGVIAALWAYLAGAEHDVIPPSLHVRSELLDEADPLGGLDGDATARAPTDAGSAVKRTPSRKQEASAWSDVRRRLATAATRVDEAAVRLRSNLRDRPFTNVAAGLAEAQAGRHAAAIRSFDQALARAPDDRTALAAKAASLTSLGRFDEATRLYERVIERAPGDVAARYNYGVLLYRRARFQEAAEQFREAVRLRPDHARAQYNLASLAQRAGRLAEARDAWRAYARLKPEVASAWMNLGIVLMDFQQPAQAADCFERALELDAEAPDSYLNLGLAYLAEGNGELALDVMAVAEELSPCDPVVLRHLAAVHDALARAGGTGAEQHRHMADRLMDEVDDATHESLDPRRLAGDAARDRQP